jgi:hypothetical protein
MSDEEETATKRRPGRPSGKYGQYKARKPRRINSAVDEADEIYSELNREPRAGKGAAPGKDAKGRFLKGHVSNPSGASKAVQRIFNNLALEARKYSGMALDNLVDLAQHAENETVRLGATLAILDRGFGKPAAALSIQSDGPLVQVNLFQDIPLEEQRLAAETLAAIESNPAGLALALDILGDEQAMTGTIPDDVLEVVPAPMRGSPDDDGSILDLTAETVG